MASSSSSSVNSWNYGVFLSFRGADTRNGFTGHLYQALYDRGINVFIDNELQRGEVITSELLRIIEASRISIVVLSENYASSPFCLDEVVKILECSESKGQIVLPVFYHVDPTDVEEQKGAFGDEFAKLEGQLNEQLNYWKVVPAKAASFCRYVLTNIREMWPIFDELDEQRNHNNEGASTNMDRVHKWRLTLTEVARLSGWHLEKGDHEATTIQSIVKMVLKHLDRTQLHVAEQPVGLASRVDYFLLKLSLEWNDVRMLGLHGMGGIGKTTTAKALYNRCVSQFEFDGSSFLLNVRETSKKHNLAHLQETLLFEILGDQKHLMGNFDKGISLIKERLGGKKVLIVIDDVDHIEQLHKLAGRLEWFGSGSRIIITTRDSHLLTLHGVTTVHEINKLGDDEAKKLFSWHAFKKPQPGEAYIELSKRVLTYAQGLPLALEVLGLSLYGRDVPMWEDVLKKLKQCPNNEITDILKVSYDGLNREEKAIFLDIACFFEGKKKDKVVKFLDACGFHANVGLQRLTEKSLVYAVWEGRLEMHDLLREMGTQIGLEESSRLCIRKPEDIRVFLENKRPYDIEGILLDFHGGEEVPLDLLEKLTNLRILIIRGGRFIGMPKSLPNSIRWLEWCNCPLKSLPPGFLPANLFVLEMPWSSIEHLLKAFMVKSKEKKFTNLTHLDLRGCESLREIGDFSAMPNLEKLDLSGCKKLKEIDKSIKDLKKLEYMSLGGCTSLVSLPNLVENEHLKILLLDGCSKLEKLPYLPTSLVHLQFSLTRIKEISWYMGILTNLERLDLTGCLKLKKLPDLPTSLVDLKFSWTGIKEIPSHIENLTNLKRLDLTGCLKLEKLPNLPTSLVDLQFSWTGIKEIPSHIENLTNLKRLDLTGCLKLEKLPNLPTSLVDLQFSCTGIKEIPSYIGNLTNLSHIKASFCLNLVSISTSILKLPHLSTLDLQMCPKLTKFTEGESFMISSSLFPHLETLDLSENNFVTLPTCISRFDRLKNLFLEDCKWLVEIPELPRTIRSLFARNCKSLERFLNFHDLFVGDFTNCHKLAENGIQSWRRAICQFPPLRRMEEDRWSEFSIMLPGNEIPKWFTYTSESNTLSFKLPPPVINDNFIGVAFCAIFQRNPEADPFFQLCFWINGELVKYWVNSIREPESEHMWLCYNDGCYLPELLQAEEISCEFYCRRYPPDGIVCKRIGVHFMYKNQR